MNVSTQEDVDKLIIPKTRERPPLQCVQSVREKMGF